MKKIAFTVCVTMFVGAFSAQNAAGQNKELSSKEKSVVEKRHSVASSELKVKQKTVAIQETNPVVIDEKSYRDSKYKTVREPREVKKNQFEDKSLKKEKSK